MGLEHKDMPAVDLARRASNAACRFFKRGLLQRIRSESRNAGEPRQHQWCGRDSAQCRAGGRRRELRHQRRDGAE